MYAMYKIKIVGRNFDVLRTASHSNSLMPYWSSATERIP